MSGFNSKSILEQIIQINKYLKTRYNYFLVVIASSDLALVPRVLQRLDTLSNRLKGVVDGLPAVVVIPIDAVDDVASDIEN